MQRTGMGKRLESWLRDRQGTWGQRGLILGPSLEGVHWDDWLEKNWVQDLIHIPSSCCPGEEGKASCKTEVAPKKNNG